MEENDTVREREKLEKEMKCIQGFGGENLWKKISVDRR
jgi:hypothetical protein